MSEKTYKDTKFKLYRYTMTQTKQNNLPLNNKSKFELIKELFLKKELYINDELTLAYSQIYSSVDNKYIVAKIAKKKQLKIHGSPQNDFKEENIDDWPNSYLIINTDNDSETGQLIAFEHNASNFPNPFTVLKGLKNKFNESLFGDGWLIEVEPITTKKHFWEYIKSNRGQIQEVIFDFNIPNLFDERTTLQEEMKIANNDLNATSIQMKMSNEAGSIDIKENGALKSFYSQAIDYIKKGGGSWATRKIGKKDFQRSTDEDCLEIVKTVVIKADAQKHFDEVINGDQQTFDNNNLVISKILNAAKEND